jgi:hypothetical protein
MLKQTFLRGLVVVRGDREDALHAQRFRVRGELGDLVGVVSSDAGEYGDLTRCHLDGDPDDAVALIARQRRRFASRAARHQEMDPPVDLSLDQRPQRLFIDRTRGKKRRDERSTYA